MAVRRAGLLPLALLAAYAAGALYWLPRVRDRMNPDGISYLSLAQRYLEGNFGDAVSGHWGPLFSWLLIPLLAFRVEPFLACKIQTFATGLAVVFGVWLWTSRFTSMLALRAVVCLAVIPLCLTWGAFAATPDLLVVCWLTYYAYFISDPALGRRSIALAAICGALLYLSKSYGFVFFLTHFTLVCATHWLGREGEGRREAIRGYALGLAVFLAVALPWIAILSVKYGRPTFSTAASYNFGLVGPGVGGASVRDHPMNTQGLLAPASEHAVSVWDDPSRMRFPPWPAGREKAQHFLGRARANLDAFSNSLQPASPLGWLILGAGLILPLLDRLKRLPARLLFASVLSGGLFVAGYLPLMVETRYIWIVFILELVLVAGLLELSLPQFHGRSVVATLVAAAISFTFVTGSQANVSLPGPIETMSRQVVKELRKNQIDLRGRRMASNGDWGKSLYLAFLTRAQYLGAVRPDDAAVARRQMDEHRVDTFLIWGNPAWVPEYLEGFRRVPLKRRSLQFALYERER